MRSLIILEVEHGEDMDASDLLLATVPRYSAARLLNYTVRVDLPECFVLDSPEPVVKRGVWRHSDGTACVSYPDSIEWTYTEDKINCPHNVILTCFRLDAYLDALGEND